PYRKRSQRYIGPSIIDPQSYPAGCDQGPIGGEGAGRALCGLTTYPGEAMSRAISMAGILPYAGRSRSIRAPLLLAVAYLAGAKVGLAFTFDPRPVSVLWLPNAILLSALLLTPTRRWYVMLGAALVAHMAAQLPANVPLSMAACWFISNSSEALIGATLIRRYGGYP